MDILRLKTNRFWSVLVTIIILITLSGCSGNMSQQSDVLALTHNAGATSPSVTKGANRLEVTFIDVGQGDSILIQAPGGKTLLIDGGPKDGEQAVLATLKAKGVKGLSIIATHEDADHITALPNVIQNYPIDKVYLPKMPTKATATMEHFAHAMKDKGLSFTQAKAGVIVDLGEGITAVMLAPVKDTYEQENNYSAVLKLTYGDTSFLFTGDAEGESEKDMLDSKVNLKATVLKIGHHGSRYSTTDAFLKAVSPQYAVIEVGQNDYGHPTPTVLNRLQKYGVKVYQTDQQGNITVITDGKTVTVNTEK